MSERNLNNQTVSFEPSGIDDLYVNAAGVGALSLDDEPMMEPVERPEKERPRKESVAEAPEAAEEGPFVGSQTSDNRGYVKLAKETFLDSDVEDPEVAAAAERLEQRYVYRFAKRAFDIAFSSLILICFCWLFVIVAIAIKIDDPKGPVFFKQKRVTKDGREFTMYKFRSMCVDAEKRLQGLKSFNEKTGPVFKMREDPRVTRVGHWLRKLSLDEMPQFINVLKNDIAIVGPRPALPAETKIYTPVQRQRLLVKSGITCYWQTRRNRDSITFDEWVDLDLLYIKQCSLWVDFKLIVQTIGCVLTAQGN